MAISELARDCVRQLTPYQSARRIGGQGSIWLNANESPNSPLYPNPEQQLNRYPEFQPPELIHAYADYAQVDLTHILTTRGADEGIDLLIRTFCEPGTDSILINPPTYGMYAISAQTAGVNVIEYALDENFDVDYKALAQQTSAKLIFLCSPNNPTGNTVDITALRQLLKAQQDQAIIVVDEAYIEYSAASSVAALIKEYKNLVILRTLSKAFALAGCRCGFLLAQNEVIELLSKVIAPYPVPTPVAELATGALSTRLHEMIYRVEKINDERQQFVSALQSLPIVEKIFAATGNYVLVQFQRDLFREISQQGIVLRNFSDKPRLSRCIRITMGNPDEMQTTLSAIQRLCLDDQGESDT